MKAPSSKKELYVNKLSNYTYRGACINGFTTQINSTGYTLLTNIVKRWYGSLAFPLARDR